MNDQDEAALQEQRSTDARPPKVSTSLTNINIGNNSSGAILADGLTKQVETLRAQPTDLTTDNTHNDSLTAFLDRHKVKKGEPYSHTSLANPAGAFMIGDYEQSYFVALYKAGKTTCIKRRMGQYPMGSLLLYCQYVTNITAAENAIIAALNGQFKQRLDYGQEYFEGDHLAMIEVMTRICLVYSLSLPAISVSSDQPIKLPSLQHVPDDTPDTLFDAQGKDVQDWLQANVEQTNTIQDKLSTTLLHKLFTSHTNKQIEPTAFARILATTFVKKKSGGYMFILGLGGTLQELLGVKLKQGNQPAPTCAS
jgi:hypothetical protein